VRMFKINFRKDFVKDLECRRKLLVKNFWHFCVMMSKFVDVKEVSKSSSRKNRRSCCFPLYGRGCESTLAASEMFQSITICSYVVKSVIRQVGVANQLSNGQCTLCNTCLSNRLCHMHLLHFRSYK